MSFVTTVDGTRIFCKDWGPKEARPIVFSHGWPLCSDAWDGQMLFMLQQGFRVVAHDRRGHGRSDQPGQGNDMDTYADDLAAVMPHAPDGIMLPKAEGGPSLAHLGARLAVHEAQAGLPDGATRILPIATETARAVFALQTLPGSSPRLSGVTWGAEDLSADLGAETNRGEDGAWSAPFQLARNLTLMAAAAAEV